jgi:hypothetical protein
VHGHDGCHGNADGDRNADSFGYGDEHRHGNRNADGDGNLDRDQYSNSNCNADRKLDRHCD